MPRIAPRGPEVQPCKFNSHQPPSQSYATPYSQRVWTRCQWAMLVHHEKDRQGVLKVQTKEHHFIQGVYHVGLYCFLDAEFELRCFDPGVPIPSTCGALPRRTPAALEPTAGEDADPGLLEDLLAARRAACRESCIDHWAAPALAGPALQFEAALGGPVTSDAALYGWGVGLWDEQPAAGGQPESEMPAVRVTGSHP